VTVPVVRRSRSCHGLTVLLIVVGTTLCACGRASSPASAPGQRATTITGEDGLSTTSGPVPTRAAGMDSVDLSGINDPPYLIPSPPAGSGVEGRVIGDPSCGSSTPPCQRPSGPIEATVTATDPSSGAVIGSMRSVTTRDFLLAPASGALHPRRRRRHRRAVHAAADHGPASQLRADRLGVHRSELKIGAMILARARRPFASACASA
jgi:hypothetical protein